jgi:hypothetical protein
MAKKKTVTRYRDRKTGRFVAKSTWKRSRARGGTRIKRETQSRAGKPLRKRKLPRPRTLPRPERREREEREEEEEEIEYGGAIDSP